MSDNRSARANDLNEEQNNSSTPEFMNGLGKNSSNQNEAQSGSNYQRAASVQQAETSINPPIAKALSPEVDEVKNIIVRRIN